VGDAKHVVVFDRDAERLAALAAEHADVTCLQCDLTSFEAVHGAVQRVFASPRPPTVVVNNAGLIHSEVLVNLLSQNGARHSVETWHRTLDANLTSVFYVAACVVEHMVRARTKGLVINVSSISAHGNAGQSAYSAAKAGVNALTVTWGKELAPFGIRTAAVAPGFLDTPSTAASLTEDQVEHWRKSTPLRRLGRLEEVASAVRFIVENDFYNGRVLELDGGLRM
jgi:3-oxoacyl-[acyl-carrier protein] reductase